MKYLLGQETEYAIRFDPAPGHKHPGNLKLFKALKYGIRQVVKTSPGERDFIQHQFFVENGGAFYYEHLPYASDDGLIEGSTPECSGPAEALLYQRAQEKLLTRAMEHAYSYLGRHQIRGTLGLIKNCRDHLGNTYGAQENYETEPTSGFDLFAYRLAGVLYLPAYIFQWVVMPLLEIVFYLAMGLGTLACAAIQYPLELMGKIIPGRAWKGLFFALAMRFELTGYYIRAPLLEPSLLETIMYHVLLRPWMIVLIPLGFALRLFVFRKQRRVLTAFLASRAIISGAGTLRRDGTLALGEKLEAVRRINRFTIGPDDRPLFDNGNLQKDLLLGAREVLLLRKNSLKRTLAPPRRLQLGASDSNRAEFAEYLKFGTTLLVLRACEAGYLDDAPILKHPVRAIHTLNGDPSLKARATIRPNKARSSARAGGDLTSLEIQRLYLAAVQRFLKAAKHIPLEYHEIARSWKQTLDALERDPSELIGRLDWVSKRYLMETAGAGSSFAVKKKIDIAYHELERGYFDKLREAGIAPRITRPEDVERAVHEPPSPESAQARAGLIKGLLFPGKPVTVSWNTARVGRMGERRVVSLDEFRKREN